MVGTRMRVLIVDDDPLSRELIEEYLEGPNYETSCACDGLEAWEILQEKPNEFDVVLLDRMMPRMDGMALLRRIKKHPKLTHLPVIMETAAADGQDVVEGITAGAYYYLTKPLDHEMLVSMVRAAAWDYERYRELLLEVQKGAGMLNLMRAGVFEFRTPQEATDLGTFLAKAYPDPERVVMGLSELMINAVEHGNLEITYEEKSELNRTHRWESEIKRRLSLPEYADRRARVSFERDSDEIRVSIIDNGPGFDPGPYLQIEPSRVFDSHGRGIAIANLLCFDAMEYCQGGREVVASINLPS